jgi:hypothetical protein
MAGKGDVGCQTTMSDVDCFVVWRDTGIRKVQDLALGEACDTAGAAGNKLSN